MSSSGSANIATVKVEGKANYLFDHPFGLKRYPLPKSVLVEQVLIPTRDGINLALPSFVLGLPIPYRLLLPPRCTAKTTTISGHIFKTRPRGIFQVAPSIWVMSQSLIIPPSKRRTPGFGLRMATPLCWSIYQGLVVLN